MVLETEVVNAATRQLGSRTTESTESETRSSPNALRSPRRGSRSSLSQLHRSVLNTSPKLTLRACRLEDVCISAQALLPRGRIYKSHTSEALQQPDCVP